MERTMTTVITLVLSKKEAQWLHVALQNPLNGMHPSDESQEDTTMRRAFFNATDTQR